MIRIKLIIDRQQCYLFKPNDHFKLKYLFRWFAHNPHFNALILPIMRDFQPCRNQFIAVCHTDMLSASFHFVFVMCAMINDTSQNIVNNSALHFNFQSTIWLIILKTNWISGYLWPLLDDIMRIFFLIWLKKNLRLFKNMCYQFEGQLIRSK